VRCTHLDVCITSMVIFPLLSEVELPVVTPGIDFGVFSPADVGGRFCTARDRLWSRWSDDCADWGAGGSVEAAPQARTGKSELLWTAWSTYAVIGLFVCSFDMHCCMRVL